MSIIFIMQLTKKTEIQFGYFSILDLVREGDLLPLVISKMCDCSIRVFQQNQFFAIIATSGDVVLTMYIRMFKLHEIM